MCNANVIRRGLVWWWLLVASASTTTEAAKAMHFSQSYQEHLKVMTSLLDDFYDPCEDFFHHACGYYDTEVAAVAPFMYNKEAAVRFFENHRWNFSTKGGMLLNGLYESCKERKWDASQWKDVEFLAEFAKWPFLHYQWEAAGIETPWTHLAARLAAGGIPVFVEIFFAQNTIYVSPAHITCPASQEDIKAMIISPATNVVSNQIAEIISSELWFFCRELIGDLPTSTERTNATSDSFTDSLHFSNEFFSALGFTPEEIEDSRKIQIRTERLEEILDVVHRTETRIVINFMIWKMLQALDYDDCFRLTEEFEPLLLSEYWHWDVFEPKLSKDVALASFFYHTTRFQKRRKDLLVPEDWVSFLDKRLRKKDLNIERVIKNYANSELSAEALASDYSNLQMQTETFHRNYFSMKSRQLRLSFVQDNYVDREDVNHAMYFVRKFLNFVIITERLPLFHYFSTEGFDLWHDSGLLATTDDLYAAIDCLSRQTEVYTDEYSIFGSLTTDQMEEVLKFNRAFYESFYDYLFWLEGEMFSFAEDYVLEHFNLNSSRVLFYSVAQLHCGRDDARYATLINRSFMNSLEFQNAFECDVEVPMNPTVKCMCKDC